MQQGQDNQVEEMLSGSYVSSKLRYLGMSDILVMVIHLIWKMQCCKILSIPGYHFHYHLDFRQL